MCGICGKIDPGGVSQEEIKRMTSVLAHRGPDDEGVVVKNTVGFGHRRLSIIDLGGGQQPMSDEDGNLLITFNGEIYNFQELKKELEEKYRFRTNSDTEVILRLYAEKGEDCVKYLRGMFAFAIYDSLNKKLFLARDHLGQKPLYYYHDGSVFVFASEIKAILEIAPELRQLDCNALYEYLTIRIITPPRSMFRNIRKLAPGHSLSFHNGKVDIKPYWQLKYEPKLKGNFNEILEELDRQVETSVKYHLVSDVPVGAFLSGGMDSSIIVAMMAKYAEQPVPTFSGDVPYQNYSEIPYARMVVEKYKTSHHEISLRPSLILKIADLVRHLDEPSDPLSVCLYYLAEFTRKHVKVVLGGDGGDELFGGYDRYYANNLVSYYAFLPEFIRKHILEQLIHRIPDSFWYKSLSHKIKWMHQISFYQRSKRYAKSLGYFYFSDRFKEQLYTNKFRNSVGMFDPEGSIKKYFNSNNAAELVDKMLYADSMVRMPDHPNMILDRMTMAHGLEARSPFLDHRLAEFCAAIPSKFKIRTIRKRFIEEKLAKKYLPYELIKKRKQGFSSALPYILNNEFRILFKTFLTDSSLVREGYINKPAVSYMLREHLTRRVDHGNRLWLLCNAEIWFRMYIENQSKDRINALLH